MPRAAPGIRSVSPSTRQRACSPRCGRIPPGQPPVATYPRRAVRERFHRRDGPPPDWTPGCPAARRPTLTRPTHLPDRAHWPGDLWAVCCRSEEHTSELQSPCSLVCRLLLEKKKARQGEALKKWRKIGQCRRYRCGSLTVGGAPDENCFTMSRFFFLSIRPPPSFTSFPNTPLSR